MVKMIIFTIWLAVLSPGLTKAQKAASSKGLTYEIIAVSKDGFGYDIYRDGKMIIHQNSIPAVGGNNGFASKQRAAKAAKLVITKIKKGEMPPAVTEQELKKIGAL